MKKKILSVFLTVLLTGMVLSGCGSVPEEKVQFEEGADTEEKPEQRESEKEKPEQEKPEADEQGMMTVYLPTRVVMAESDGGMGYFLEEREYEYDNYGNIKKVSRYRADDQPWWSEEVSAAEEAAVEVMPEEGAPPEAMPEEGAPAEVMPEEEAPAEAMPAEEAAAEAPAEESFEKEATPKATGDNITEIVAEAEKDIAEVTANDTLYEFEYEYDAMGRVAKKTKYSMWADSEGGINKYLAYEDEYEYDENGTPLKLKATLFYDREPEAGELPYDGEVHYVEELEYDGYGNETKSISTYPHENSDGSDRISGSIYEYEYDTEGRIIEEVRRDQSGREDGSMRDPFVYSHEYDERGNRIRTAARHILEDGTESEEGGYTIDYEYDSNDRLIQKTTFRFDNGKFYTDEYTYDADGRLTRLVSDGMLNAGGVTTVENTYDANGNIVRMIKDIYNEWEEGEHDIAEREHEYDANGNIIRETLTYPSGITEMNEYVYDEKDNIIRIIHTEAGYEDAPAEESTGAGTGEEILEYEYDENDNITRETTIEPDGDRHIIEYTYDANGNLIGETRYTSNGGYVAIYRYEYMEMQIPKIKNSRLRADWERDGTLIPELPSARKPEDLSEYWKNSVGQITLNIMEKDNHSDIIEEIFLND